MFCSHLGIHKMINRQSDVIKMFAYDNLLKLLVIEWPLCLYHCAIYVFYTGSNLFVHYGYNSLLDLKRQNLFIHQINTMSYIIMHRMYLIDVANKLPLCILIRFCFHFSCLKYLIYISLRMEISNQI